MSYRTKESKRAESVRRRAVKKARRQSSDVARRDYLTLSKRSSRCEECTRKVSTGREIVYRHEPRRVLCKACADRLRIDYRPSSRWEQARRKRKPSRTRRVGASELVAELVIEAAITPRGGWTKSQLARWGIDWPPTEGWRRQLVTRWSA